MGSSLITNKLTGTLSVERVILPFMLNPIGPKHCDLHLKTRETIHKKNFVTDPLSPLMGLMWWVGVCSLTERQLPIGPNTNPYSLPQKKVNTFVQPSTQN